MTETEEAPALAFTDLLDRYVAFDPAATKKIQSLRAAMSSQDFLRHIRIAIEEKPASFPARLPATLVGIDDVSRMLLDVYGQSKRRAIAIAKKLLLGDPQFDIKLLHCVSDRENTGWADDDRLIALDILDAISERDRLVLAVSTLLRQPNQKLRSKAALFIARRRPGLNWISDLSGHSDARFRANVIEGLLGAEEPFIARLFRKHALDENNRVVGNAVLGLYRLGDLEAIQMIDQMGVDERTNFRVTSAWVMGQTGDPRFSATLAGFLTDQDSHVRQVALKGLGEIRKSLAEARGHTRLQFSILRYDRAKATKSLVGTACDSSDGAVRGIKPTRFFLKAGSNYVRKYRVEEHAAATPVHAAVILCLPSEGEGEISEQFERAMSRCLKIFRKKDEVTTTKISFETCVRCSATGVQESKAILKTALSGVDFDRGNLNVVVVGAGASTLLFDRLLEVKTVSNLRLSTVAMSPEWQTADLRSRTLASGGYFQTATTSTLSQVCFPMISSLLHHYRITWESGEGDVELEVQSERGVAYAQATDSRRPEDGRL